MLLQCSLFQRSLFPGDALRGLLTFSPPETGLTNKMWGGAAPLSTSSSTSNAVASSTQDTWRVEVVGIMDGVSRLGVEMLKGFSKRADGSGYVLFSAEHSPIAMDDTKALILFSVCLPESLPPTYKGSMVKFSYLVIVEAFRKQQVLASLKIPLRVRLNHKKGAAVTITTSLVCPLSLVLLSANNPVETELPIPPPTIPFGEEQEDSKSIPGLFKVSQTDEEGLNIHVVSLLLSTQAVRAGGQLQGLLDFVGAEVVCSRVELCLKLKETQGGTVVSSRTYHTQTINVNMCLTRNFSIVFPKVAPPTLDCTLLTVAWEIELKFVVTDNVLLWCFPIIVLACSERTNLIAVKSALIP